MTSALDVVHETEMHLLSGDRGELNLLAGTVNEVVSSLAFSRPLGGIQPGASLSIDLESMYVLDVNDSGQTATVLRSQLGSPAEPHGEGSTVYVNPLFSYWSILKAINVELEDLSPELFAVGSFTVTTQPVRMTYTIPDPRVTEILDIRYLPPGPEFAWDRITRDKFSILRGMPIDSTDQNGFSTGVALRVDQRLYPGRTMAVRYARPFGNLSTLVDDVTDTTGLVESSTDILALGAAARLMGVRGARRTFLEVSVDTRRATEVPVGAAMQAAQGLYMQVENRIKSEVEVLRKQWPIQR